MLLYLALYCPKSCEIHVLFVLKWGPFHESHLRFSHIMTHGLGSLYSLRWCIREAYDTRFRPPRPKLEANWEWVSKLPVYLTSSNLVCHLIAPILRVVPSPLWTPLCLHCFPPSPSLSSNLSFRCWLAEYRRIVFLPVWTFPPNLLLALRLHEGQEICPLVVLWLARPATTFLSISTKTSQTKLRELGAKWSATDAFHNTNGNAKEKTHNQYI